MGEESREIVQLISSRKSLISRPYLSMACSRSYTKTRELVRNKGFYYILAHNQDVTLINQ